MKQTVTKNWNNTMPKAGTSPVMAPSISIRDSRHDGKAPEVSV